MASGAVRDPERARRWLRERGWRVGCNFAPSTASNPLEMWQAPTFDLETIERELGWAAGLGFTSVRVFLHDLVWRDDRSGLVERLDRFLAAASSRGIGALLVLFDGVWDPHPRPGPQPEPRPRVHNSRWVQSPGAEILGDPSRHDEVRPYVQGLIDRFRDDARVDGWDLFNEPDNRNPAYAGRELPDKAERALELLRKAFDWARDASPAQPLTAGLYGGRWTDPDQLSEMNRLCVERSDVLSFHHYGGLGALERRAAALERYGRPLLCTEFLARGLGCTFDPCLGWLKDRDIGAYCWGLVAGRTQTQYPWDSWTRSCTAEPVPWHHDIFRPDGAPYDPGEVAYIRSVTGA